MLMMIDCEFNGFGGELISLAIVTADGHEFYEVLKHEQPTHPWVEQNVIPLLGKEPISKLMFQMALEDFLCGYEEVHIIADWPTDLELLCKAITMDSAYRISLPERFSMEICPWLQGESKVPHNALWDARANMESWIEHSLEEKTK